MLHKFLSFLLFAQIFSFAPVLAASAAQLNEAQMSASQTGAPNASNDGASDEGVSDEMGVRFDTPSGEPVPRFVSLKAAKTNCRSGPSFEHPVRIIFVRRGLPVAVVAETTNYWRKVRDADGDECWVHRSKLSGAATTLILEDRLPLRKLPNYNAQARAYLGERLIARVLSEKGDWLQLSVDGVKGWAPRNALWGGPMRSRFSTSGN